MIENGNYDHHPSLGIDDRVIQICCRI